MSQLIRSVRTLSRGIPTAGNAALSIKTRGMSTQVVDEEATSHLQAHATTLTNSEAFVETLVAQGVTDTFGIVGSAFMDALDLFPSAGIRFISVQHEQGGAHMADGYARATGRAGVCIAQNGPGITNFVTGIAAAYWAHSPVVCITPESGTMTKGYGGFQEVDQLPIFSAITKWQGHVNNPARMAEITSRAFDYAIMERGPTQLNIPRDFFYGETSVKIPKPNVPSRSAGSSQALDEAAKLIASAKNPVILAGGGVAMGNAVDEVAKLAEMLGAPVACTYLHNDSFPASHPLACGPLGYCGFKSAMHAIQEADVVIALGTRLSPFGILPQYGMSYWPEDAQIIQVDIDQRRVGLTRQVAVPIVGDAKLAAEALAARLDDMSVASADTKAERFDKVQCYKAAWEEDLDEMTEGPEVDGLIKPRAALRELEKAMPKNAMVSTDIGNVCSVSNSYLRFDEPNSFMAAMSFGNCGYAFPAIIGAKVGRPDRPAIAYVGDGAWGMSLNETFTCVREKIPVTVVVFHNNQWGAEKKNQVLWFGDRYVGTNLGNVFSYAEVARSMGAEGITCTSKDQVGDALKQAVQNQEEGKTTIIELMLTKELGEPFRRDAMKLPQRKLSKYMSTNESSESATGQPVDVQK